MAIGHLYGKSSACEIHLFLDVTFRPDWSVNIGRSSLSLAWKPTLMDAGCILLIVLEGAT